jgi:phage-related protein
MLAESPLPAQARDRTIAPFRSLERPKLVSFERCDIISDITVWSLELEPEVRDWVEALPGRSFGSVAFHLDRLGERGSGLRLPHSRSLGDGLFELRFDNERIAWRITYFFAGDRRIVALTVFRKQRDQERTELVRARAAMARCIAEGHLVEEED